MRLIDLTFTEPAENVAFDEALLEEAEAGQMPQESLRLWESSRPMVVVGRGSRIAEEVDREACRHDAVPILRRTSGGLAIVTGPGCLMYSLVLSYEQRPELRDLDRAHGFILEQMVGGLSNVSPKVRRRGTSDLALEDRKFSGNSMRCKRGHLLYHGTLLYAFPLEQISRYLTQPPRAPAYRQDRAHDQFVTNLNVPAAELRQCLVRAWGADESLPPSDRLLNDRVRELVAEKCARRLELSSLNRAVREALRIVDDI